MSDGVTYQMLNRLSFLPDREALKNGTVIAGQTYYDVYFTGGTIGGVNFDGFTGPNDWLNALLPSQTGQSGKALKTDGSNASWQVDISSGITELTGDVIAGPGSGSQASTLEAIQGTTVTGTTGSGNVVFDTGSAIGTPDISGGTLTGSAITSSSIDSSIIGGSTPAAGTFTTLDSDGVNTDSHITASGTGRVFLTTHSGDIQITTNSGTANLFLSSAGPTIIQSTELDITSPTFFTDAINYPPRIFTNAGNVNFLSSDYVLIINKGTGAATTVNLPPSPDAGRFAIIADGKGDAATNNITINGNGNNINGSPTFVINSTYGSATLEFNGTEWNIFSVKSTTVSGTSTDNAVVRWDGTGANSIQNSGVIIDDNNGITGYRAVLATESGTSFTLSEATHGAKTTLTTNGSAVTITCPNSLGVGVEGELIQNGAGQVTFSAGSGATVQNRQSQLNTAGQYAAVRWKVVSNSGGSSAVYNIAGDTA